jgi:ABC-2 type transport system ATP-binding protein
VNTSSLDSVVELRHIVRSFVRGRRVLDDVSLTIRPEEVVALLGRNGAGKSTLMQIIMGQLFPDEGSVRVFGYSPTDEPVAVKRRIGVVGQSQLLPPDATLPDLISLFRKLYPKWDTALERSLLERFGLAGNRQKIKTLSRGQAQQCALLLAVCHRPELLLLDEPAAGLDPAARRDFLETSIQLLNREGTAILFSSHHMGDVERLGGRALLLDGGRIRLDRSLDALREAHCVAVIPRSAIADMDTIQRVSGCLHVRAVRDDWHVVCEGTPQFVAATLAQQLGVVNIACTRVSLEELFVEMVGDSPAGGSA